MTVWAYHLCEELSPGALRALVDFVKAVPGGAGGRLRVFIESGGGEVRIGLEMAHLLLSLPCEVETLALSHVNSAAVAVFAAGNRRTCTEETTFCLHPVGREMVGTFTGRELAAALREVRADTSRTASFLGKRTGRPPAFWTRAMNRSTVFTAGKAVAAGLATAIGRIPP